MQSIMALDAMSKLQGVAPHRAGSESYILLLSQQMLADMKHNYVNDNSDFQQYGARAQRVCNTQAYI